MHSSCYVSRYFYFALKVEGPLSYGNIIVVRNLQALLGHEKSHYRRRFVALCCKMKLPGSSRVQKLSTPQGLVILSVGRNLHWRKRYEDLFRISHYQLVMI